MNKHFFLKSSFRGLRYQLDFVPFTTFGKIIYTAFLWVLAGYLFSTLILAEIKQSDASPVWVSSLNITAIMIAIFGLTFITLVIFFIMSIRE
ncbi:hypothetical protein GCM10009069_00510 [Algimonas arctica]|uniref:Uncharacterized protein n=1 Tax=Algimonas arctica TaxID=1479486 RepID=A0A8J3CPA8_9PROT|nr:hypothetical protein GCM10009069_00510 [Algimonas arctica]